MLWELVGTIIWGVLLYQLNLVNCYQLLTSSTTLSRNFAICIAALAVLWHLDVELVDGLTLHFLMLTSTCLVLGFRLCCLASSAAMVLLALTANTEWHALPARWLVQILPAMVISYGSLLITRKYLPHHLFIYIFVNAFITAAIAIALSIALQATWFSWTGQFSEQQIDHYLLRMLPLMMFPEALLNGMLVTILAVYKPHCLRTFRDEDYLNN